LRRDAIANRELVVRAALEVVSEFGTLGMLRTLVADWEHSAAHIEGRQE
jgi:hypothetical protein